MAFLFSDGWSGMIKDDDHEKIGMRLVLKSILIFLVFIIVTFLSSGRLDYWQGWVFNGLNIFTIFKIPGN
jgi:hypothetical protein